MFAAVKYVFEIDSALSVLQRHAQLYQKQVIELKLENEELELFYRRIKVKNEDVPFIENEIFKEVLEKGM